MTNALSIDICAWMYPDLYCVHSQCEPEMEYYPGLDQKQGKKIKKPRQFNLVAALGDWLVNHSL